MNGHMSHTALILLALTAVPFAAHGLVNTTGSTVDSNAPILREAPQVNASVQIPPRVLNRIARRLEAQYVQVIDNPYPSNDQVIIDYENLADAIQGLKNLSQRDKGHLAAIVAMDLCEKYHDDGSAIGPDRGKQLISALWEQSGHDKKLMRAMSASLRKTAIEAEGTSSGIIARELVKHIRTFVQGS